jgi:hypothetical protein
MSNAVIHGHHLVFQTPQECNCSGSHSDTLEWRTHAWSFGVANTVNLRRFDFGLSQGLLHEPDNPLSMVFGSLFGQKTSAWRGVIGMSKISENYRRLLRRWMRYQAYAKLVR